MNATSHDIASEPGLELLRKMALRETNQEVAHQACEEYFRRFARRLFAAAYKYTYIGAHFDPEIHVSDTFISAYRHANSFKPPRMKLTRR